MKCGLDYIKRIERLEAKTGVRFDAIFDLLHKRDNV